MSDFDEYTIINAGRFAEYAGFTSDDIDEVCRRNKTKNSTQDL